MTELEKLKQSKPNLFRVSKELLELYGKEDAYKIVDSLTGLLGACAQKPTEPAKSNTEKFTDVLNSCQHPRAVFNALSAFADQRKAVQE